MRSLTIARDQWWPGLAALALLSGLLVALLPGRPLGVVLGLAALGVAATLGLTAGTLVRWLRRRPALWPVVILAALIAAWLLDAVIIADRPWADWWFEVAGHPAGSTQIGPFSWLHYVPSGSWLTSEIPAYRLTARKAAAFRIGRLPIGPLGLAVVCGAGGFVLIADAVRVQLGLAPTPRSLWRSLAASQARSNRVALRAVPGVAMIALLTFLGISLLSRYTAGDPILTTAGMFGMGALAALLIAAPLVVGLSLRINVDKATHAREDERLRFAAHLHDSVLQTLALIQRQAQDPAAVSSLARRQEHALRAWMAGEADLGAATVAGAVRDVIAEVEDERGLKVELTAIGDVRLDERSEELVSAAREALRNAAAHAPGAPVNVFLDVGADGTGLFVRDDGPGFEFDAVPTERRGLRDSVIGRMSFAGGTATVESALGEGTEIALWLPHNRHSR